MVQYDVIIIGGGLAGLTAALHLGKNGHSVLVLEKQRYPHHKVCGEYVSNEVLPYLKYLDITFTEYQVAQIDTLQFSLVNGNSITTKLPLGGIGISRYAFDDLLFRKAKAHGVDFVFENVDKVHFANDRFSIVTQRENHFTSRIVLGAYGKRSTLDMHLKRDFVQHKSTWLGVKVHYNFPNFPDNLVALHNFRGGYAGLSKTETGAINFCYLTTYDSFKNEKNIDSFNANVVSKNPFLAEFLREGEPLFPSPLSIAQISFDKKNAIENHMLMCGDSAGLIHPLCGNGMAMAIHSAKLASELISKYFSDTSFRRGQLEDAYQTTWDQTFQHRLWMGRRLQSLLLNPNLSQWALGAVGNSPWILKKLIRSTHGKPITL
ncbi:FAD-dependent oxidoreductase [Sediminicola sp. YIK13]|uniref:NAD(P)/FAD-dependent oxidoreductase n=1 Tax=Sediminicola sp. YIK13 TaxID=1453352 RepID=UPI000721CB25|nr:NAD(P)/FAD-dependent oxidoreductase [Sediminicola sp. YIK13]ALM07016.1 FAD-dependent oxidoreductase [Sediminicola sp. YIK13]